MPINIPGTCFLHVFLVFFFDLKIARDDSGLEYTNSDLGADFFCKKNDFFMLMKKLVNAKIRGNACNFRDFLYFL